MRTPIGQNKIIWPSDNANKIFKVLFLNIEGLGNKNNILSEMAIECNYGAICLNEHWFDRNSVQWELIENFKLAAAYGRSDHLRGGVAIFVREDVNFIELDINGFCSELNFEVAAVLLEDLNTILVSIYRSPSGDSNVFLDKMEHLLFYLFNLKPNLTIFVGGDYNSQFDVTTDKPNVQKFKNLLCQFNMHYANSKPTRFKACLDNIVTNSNRADYETEVVNTDLSDHLGIELCVSQNDHVNLKKPVLLKRNLSLGRLVELKVSLAGVNWNEIFINCSDAESTFEAFFLHFYYKFEEICPKIIGKPHLKKGRPTTTRQNWYTTRLAEIKNVVMALRTKCEATGSETDQDAYKRSRNAYKKAVNNAKLEFNANQIEKSDNKLKAAWALVNKIKVNASQQNNIKICPEDFNRFCVSSVEEAVNSIQRPQVTADELVKKSPSPPEEAKMVEWKMVSCEEVCRVVRSMKNSKSEDIYGLSNHLIKFLIEAIVFPITWCLNLCLCEGVFPAKLKASRVVPLHKKGDKCTPKNFRPVSVVPILGKIFEKIVKIQVCSYFNKFNLLTEAQFGYRMGRSTVDAVEGLVVDIVKAFEDGCLAQVTACDLSKAFDCVDHNILIGKLNHLGIQGICSHFLSSYLEGRSQIVDINGQRSSAMSMNVGVPQGSVLGPILFLVMMNDLPCNVSDSKSVIFADDTTFLTVNRDVNTLVHVASGSLEEAVVWFKANGFVVNETKTQKVIYSLSRPTTPTQDETTKSSVKLLGIHVDQGLTWCEHVDFVCNKLSKTVYLLKVLKNHLPSSYIYNVYYALFQSTLSYGILLWGNSSKILDVLLLQKKAVRIITSSNIREHCKPLFIQTKIMTVINLYIYMLLQSVKIKENKLLCNRDIHNYGTRQSHKIHIDYNRLTKTQRNHAVIGIKLYNHLPSHITNLGFKDFKEKVYGILVTHPFYKIQEYFEMKFDC